MKRTWLLQLIALSVVGLIHAEEKYSGDNPHALGTPEWQRYYNCVTVAEFAREFANDEVMHEAKSKEKKMKLGEMVMGQYDESAGESVETLLAKKGVELGVSFEKQPEKAFQAAWQYCMNFSLKEHYYYDTPVKDVAALELP